ncbi:hypothetical protein HO539_08520 [Streptococcus suis]|nr:hypothetical protein [Streptococcus suis]NRG69565.1 hypothetical protein [Streptococcus suis]
MKIGNLADELWKYAEKNLYKIDDRKDEVWNGLKASIENSSQKVSVRTFGDKGKIKTKEILEEFYLFVFDGKSIIKIDPSNNSKPTSVLNKFTNYTKNKDHKSKNILQNYQVSHVFRKTLNCYAFTAPWNILYLPKILDPLTGHESQGDLTQQFTLLLQDYMKENYRNQIKEFNEIMEKTFLPKIDEFKEKKEELYNRYKDSKMVDTFFKELDSNFSTIPLD